MTKKAKKVVDIKSKAKAKEEVKEQTVDPSKMSNEEKISYYETIIQTLSGQKEVIVAQYDPRSSATEAFYKVKMIEYKLLLASKYLEQARQPLEQ